MAEAERTAEVTRRTKETGVELTLRLDGTGGGRCGTRASASWTTCSISSRATGAWTSTYGCRAI
jgi:hypothetical protein